MNTKSVEKRVAQIQRMSEDDEAAHSAEDRLYTEILQWLAKHSTDENARSMATAALKTEQIKFMRWCA